MFAVTITTLNDIQWQRKWQLPIWKKKSEDVWDARHNVVFRWSGDYTSAISKRARWIPLTCSTIIMMATVTQSRNRFVTKSCNSAWCRRTSFNSPLDYIGKYMHFVLVLVEIKVAVRYSKATENITSLFLLISWFWCHLVANIHKDNFYCLQRYVSLK